MFKILTEQKLRHLVLKINNQLFIRFHCMKLFNKLVCRLAIQGLCCWTKFFRAGSAGEIGEVRRRRCASRRRSAVLDPKILLLNFFEKHPKILNSS